MIKETFSTKTWKPANQENNQEWIKFKQEAEARKFEVKALSKKRVF